MSIHRISPALFHEKITESFPAKEESTDCFITESLRFKTIDTAYFSGGI